MKSNYNPIIYIVMQGEYSDRTAMAAFLDKEKAEKYAEILSEVEGSWGGAYVTDLAIMDDKVDMETPITSYYHYTLYFDDPYSDDDYEEDEIVKRQCNIECFHDTYTDYIEAYSTKSYEHAKKIAQEAYQVYTQNQAVERGDL